MKIRSLFLSTLFFILFQDLKAQVWFGNGDTYVYDYLWWGNWGYDELTVAGDSVVYGQDCKVLDVYRKTVCPDIYTGELILCYDGTIGKLFFYEQGDSVFYLDQNSGTYRLQYDFSMEPGDSLFLCEYDNLDVFLMLLDSVELITIQSATRKKQYFTVFTTCFNQPYHYLTNAETIEGIGLTSVHEMNPQWSTSYLIPEVLFSNFSPCVEDGESWKLRCYNSGAFNYELVADCYELPSYVNSTFEKSFDDKIMLSPNPVSNKLNLDTPPEITLIDFEIFSIIGERGDCQNNILQEINVGDLKSGIYILKMVFKEGTVNKRFVKL